MKRVGKKQDDRHGSAQTYGTAFHAFFGAYCHPDFMFAEGYAGEIGECVGSNGNKSHKQLLGKGKFAHEAENYGQIHKGNKAEGGAFHVGCGIFLREVCKAGKGADKGGSADAEKRVQMRNVPAKEQVRKSETAVTYFKNPFFVFGVKKGKEFPLSENGHKANKIKNRRTAEINDQRQNGRQNKGCADTGFEGRKF